MKNKIHIYALTLSLGIFSPLSCAMEDVNVENLIKDITTSDQRLLTSLIGFKSSEKSRFVNSDSNINCNFLYNKLLDKIKNDGFNNKAIQKTHIEKLPRYVQSIDKIDASIDLDIHNYFKSFFEYKKVIVKVFKDYLKKEYKDMLLPAVDSRQGNILYMAQYTGSTFELGVLQLIACRFYNVYRKIFNLPEKLESNHEQLKFKTRFIHFIEDYLKPYFSKIYSGTCSQNADHYYDGYNRLFCIVSYLYSIGMLPKILDVWRSYCDNNFTLPNGHNKFQLSEEHANGFKEYMKKIEAIRNRNFNYIKMLSVYN